MGTKQFLIIIAFVVGFFGTGISTGFASEKPLTIEEARILAAENSSSLQNASLSMGREELEQAALRYDLFPVLSVNAALGGGYSLPQVGDSVFSFNPSAGLTLTQRVYQGGTYGIQKELGGVEFGLASVRWKALFLEVRNRSDRFFYNYLESLSRKEAAEKEVQAAEALFQSAAAQYEAGMVPKTTYLKVRADAAAKELKLERAETDTLFSGAQLASYLGLDTLPEVTRTGPEEYTSRIEYLAGLEPSVIDKTLQKLTACALETSPTFRETALNTEKAGLNAELLKKQYVPKISVSISDSISLNNDFELGNNGSVTISGSLALSQWDRRQTVQKADFSVRQAENSAEETVRLCLLEVRKSWYDLIGYAKSVVSSRTALEHAEELYQETYERYNISAAVYSDLADAEALASTNRTAYIGSQYDFLISLSSLVYTLGLKDDGKLWELLEI